jgi:DtxR family Mn-dependent transcriptional regulator
MEARKIEELLEAIYTEREAGRDEWSAVLAHAGVHAAGSRFEDLRELESLGLAQVDGTRMRLAEEGERRARGVVRRHRLAERLFRDLLDASEGTMESQACEFGTRRSRDSVCTLLNPPPTCPRGRPSRGCAAPQRTVRLVTGLEHATSRHRPHRHRPKFHDRMDGWRPGRHLTASCACQRAPPVIEVGETTIALDPGSPAGSA